MVGSRSRRALDRENRANRNRGGDAENENSVSSVRNSAAPEGGRNGGAPPPPPPPDFMQAFLAGVAQFAANAANGGGNRNPIPADPFLGALRESERHRTMHFDGSGGYAARRIGLGLWNRLSGYRELRKPIRLR